MSLLSIFNMIDPVSFLIPLMILLVFSLIKHFKTKCQRDPRLVEFAKNLPGPPGYPLVGNSLNFCQEKETLKVMLEYKEKYGDIYRLWLGKYLAIGLSNIDDLENVFMSSKMLLTPKLLKPFEEFFGDGLFTTYCIPQWRKYRRIFQPLFHHNVLHLYTSTMNEKINSMVDKMKHLVDGPEFDAFDYLPYLSFDIILKATMNVDLNWDDKMALQYHVAIANASIISFRKVCRPWLQYKLIDDLFYQKHIKQSRKEVVEFLQKLIRDKKGEILHQIEVHKNKTTNSEDIPPKTFLTLAYELAEIEKSEKLLIDELLHILTGGTDSPSIMNALFLLAVAIHQDIQNKLYDELYEVFGDSDRVADENDMARLPYLEQVLKETLRRFPIVPLMFREVEEDAKLGNRVIPAGTIIIVSIAAIHFNPEFYPDPWKFNPEHFSPEAVEKRHKLSFLSFSAGPKNCIGIYFAMLEMKLTLSTLLRNFSFHTKMKMEDIYMDSGIAMTSVNGYKLTMKSRIRKPSYLQNK